MCHCSGSEPPCVAWCLCTPFLHQQANCWCEHVAIICAGTVNGIFKPTDQRHSLQLLSDAAVGPPISLLSHRSAIILRPLSCQKRAIDSHASASTDWPHLRAVPPPLLPFAGNGLKELPTSIGALSSLRTLRLSDNSLTALPAELASLPSLTEVHLGGNSGLDAEKVMEMLGHKPQMAIVWDSTGDGAARNDAEPAATATR